MTGLRLRTGGRRRVLILSAAMTLSLGFRVVIPSPPARPAALEFSRPAPTPESFKVISAGHYHTCGLALDGWAYCWGDNSAGELGDGTQSDRHVPVPVSGGLAFSDISAGYYHTCAVGIDGKAYCWGDGGQGQLGDGSLHEIHVTPRPVSGSLAFVEISAGRERSCGVTTEGRTYCWGDNADGGLGDNTQANSAVPVALSGAHHDERVDAGHASHSCSLAYGGALYCWGGNRDGGLGDGTVVARLSPTRVVGGIAFATVSVGAEHTCALAVAGPAYCWGQNTSGQLGDERFDALSTRPVLVAGELTFRSLSAGHYHTCGVAADGTAYCWGDNGSGELGDGSTSGTRHPVRVAGSLTFAVVSAGHYHTCGVTTEGVAYCWGGNSEGELGNGTTRDSDTPLRVAGVNRGQ